jgi:hypothetical protein
MSKGSRRSTTHDATGAENAASTPPPRLALVAWIALAVLLVLLLWTTWQGPDIFYHLYLGRQVLATGDAQPADQLLVQQPSFINIYWLFQVACQGVYALGGIRAVSLLFVLLWMIVLAYWLRTTRAWQYPAVGAPFALVSLLVLQNRFDLRPEIVSYGLLAMQVYWLSTWDLREGLGWRRALSFTAVEVVWANVHGYFVLGPLLVGGLLLVRALGRNGRATVPALARLLILTLVATCISPLGAKTWLCVIYLWRFLREMGADIREFAPPTGEFLTVWTIKLFWVYWGATVLACGWLAVRRRLRADTLVFVVPGLYLSATGARNVPLLVLLGAPLWRDLFADTAAPRRSRRVTASGRRLVGLVTTTSILVTAGVAIAIGGWVVNGGFYHSLRSEAEFGVGLPRHAFAVTAVDHLATTSFAGRLFNSAADGGFMQYYLADVQPYMDSRYTDAAPVREYFAGLRDPVAFRRLHELHAFDGVLLKVVDSGRVLIPLLGAPGWRLAHADLHRAFLVPHEGADEGGEASDEPALAPRFYDGEDLSRRVNGMAAIQWVAILMNVGNRPLLVTALQQLAEAPHIPSFVIQYALAYGLEKRDAEIVEIGRAMVPRMLALDVASRTAVENLVRAVDARRMVRPPDESPDQRPEGRADDQSSSNPVR